MTPNELVKYGGTDGRQVGSRILVDSARHLSQVTRLTLDSGLALSVHGLDMADTSISRVKELEADIVYAKQIVLAGSSLGAPPLPPPSLSPPIEFPDDMVLESLQCQTLLVSSIGGASVLCTDSSGTFKALHLAPHQMVSTDEFGKLITKPFPAHAPAPALAPALPASLVHCHVPMTDYIPRFTEDEEVTLTSSCGRIDDDGKLTGISSIEALRGEFCESLTTEQLTCHTLTTKTVTTDKLILGTNTFSTSAFRKNLYVSNGPFQPIGVSGEGLYSCNLKAALYSLYCQISVGKTKIAYRSAFGPIGGVKSVASEEHESDGGYDFIVMTLPELGKVSFGVEQKTGDLVLKTDQPELLNMDVFVQKTHVTASVA